MSENYIVINGKKTNLTDEQLKQLGIGIEVRNNPFERVKKGRKYWSVDENNDLCDYEESDDFIDATLYDVANYFNDTNFAEQVGLHQLLYRKLLRFAYDNGCEDHEWNGNNEHYSICYDYYMQCFLVPTTYNVKSRDVFFSSKEDAQRAIKEVVEPFMKEHPEFVW